MLVHAKKTHLDDLLKLIKKHYENEKRSFSRSNIQSAVLPLVKKDSTQGRMWFIEHNKDTVGYVALCFSYSIEEGGETAFIDQFFIESKHRSKSLEQKALKEIMVEVKKLKRNFIRS